MRFHAVHAIMQRGSRVEPLERCRGCGDYTMEPETRDTTVCAGCVEHHGSRMRDIRDKISADLSGRKQTCKKSVSFRVLR